LPDFGGCLLKVDVIDRIGRARCHTLWQKLIAG